MKNKKIVGIVIESTIKVSISPKSGIRVEELGGCVRERGREERKIMELRSR